MKTGEKLYRVVYLFKGKAVFIVEFKADEGLSPEELDKILSEQAAIMKGERKGILKELEQ